MSRLTERQRLFCLYYTSDVETKGDGKASALKAGYSENGAKERAHEMVHHHEECRKVIDDAYAEIEFETRITQKRVMAELGRIAFADPRRVVKWKGTRHEKQFDEDTGEPTVVEIGNHVELVNSDEISTSDAAAISEVSEGQHGIKIKFHPKVAALIELGKHLGLATKIAHTGHKGSGPVELITTSMTAEQAAEAYAKTLNEE